MLTYLHCKTKFPAGCGTRRLQTYFYARELA